MNYSIMHLWLNWIERLATNEKVGGSSPSRCTNIYTEGHTQGNS